MKENVDTLTEGTILLHQHVTAEQLWPLTTCIHLRFIYYCKLVSAAATERRKRSAVETRKTMRETEHLLIFFSSVLSD